MSLTTDILSLAVFALVAGCGETRVNVVRAGGGAANGSGAGGETGGAGHAGAAGAAGAAGTAGARGPPGVVTHDGPLTVGDTWSRAWGGDGWCESQAVAFAPDGSIYVTGWFTGTADFDPDTGVVAATSVQNTGVFLSRFDPDGNLERVQTWIPRDPVPWDRWGSEGWALAVDDAGDAYLGGQYSGTIDLDPGSGLLEYTATEGFDGFLIKLSADGELFWGTAWQTSASAQSSSMGRVRTIEISEGGVLVSGQFGPVGELDPGPGEDWRSATGVPAEGFAPDSDCALVAVTPAGDLRWARTWGSENSEYSCMGAARGQRVVASGESWGTVDLDPGPDEDEHVLLADYDAWLIGLDGDGSALWSRTWAGSGHHSAEALMLLADGGLVGGSFYSEIDFMTVEQPSLRQPGERFSAYVLRFADDGVPQWVRTWGDTGEARTIDVTGTEDEVLVAGKFQGEVDFDTATHTAALDAAFVRAFSFDGQPLWTRVPAGGSSFAGSIATKDGVVAVVGGFYDTVDFDFGQGSDVWTSTDLYGCWLVKFPVQP
jgi:hypothetical protein